MQMKKWGGLKNSFNTFPFVPDKMASILNIWFRVKNVNWIKIQIKRFAISHNLELQKNQKYPFVLENFGPMTRSEILTPVISSSKNFKFRFLTKDNFYISILQL